MTYLFFILILVIHLVKRLDTAPSGSEQRVTLFQLPKHLFVICLLHDGVNVKESKQSLCELLTFC